MAAMLGPLCGLLLCAAHVLGTKEPDIVSALANPQRQSSSASPSSDLPRLHPSQPFANRRLEQSSQRSEDIECRLRPGQVERFLNAQERTWLLDSAALSEVQNDLQRVVDCTRAGDTLLLSPLRQIQPAGRVAVRWNLTIRGEVEEPEFEYGFSTEGAQRPTLTCPPNGEGVLVLSGREVLLTELGFEDCVLSGAAVIEVSRCSRRDATRTVELRSITFVGNAFSESSAFSSASASCARAVLVDVDFVDNTCGGDGCGGHFASETTLRRIRLEGNEPASTLLREPSMLFFGRGVDAVVEGIEATDNLLSIVRTENASLELTEGRFLRNALPVADAVDGYGACLSLVHSGVAVRASLFSSNRAQFGAGVAVSGGEVTIRDSTFERNWATRGGAVHLREGLTTLRNCTFDSNNARQDGGAVLRHFARLRLIDCSFSRDSADLRGGSVASSGARLDIVRSSFFGGRAPNGSFVHQIWGDLRIADSTFRGGRAALWGGALFVSLSEVNVSSSEFSGCSAKVGGALAVSGHVTVLRMRDTVVSGCVAEDEAGGVLVYPDAYALFMNATFVLNSAQRGGAVSLSVTQYGRSPVQFEGGRFQNNNAAFGGGLHFDRTSNVVEVWSEGCQALFLDGTYFLGNAADVAGGAIFTSFPNNVRVSCPNTAPLCSGRFCECADIKSRPRLKIDLCVAWRDNSCGKFGPIVASNISAAKGLIRDAATGASRPLEANADVVFEHRSGAVLPMIELEVEDQLGQGPAVNFDSNVVHANLTCPAEFQLPVVSLNLVGGALSSVGFVGYGRPGFYACQINFAQGGLRPIGITFHVVDCKMGEVLAGNGVLCEPCPADAFNFDPTHASSCHACPPNGNCSLHVILPAGGYWHSGPCSERMQRCLTTRACQYEGRGEALGAAVEDISNCTLTQEKLLTYTGTQCNSGYKGPLCGACRPSFAKALGNLCRQCPSKSQGVTLMLLTLLSLVVICAITIRSNLKSVKHLHRCRTSSSSSDVSVEAAAAAAAAEEGASDSDAADLESEAVAAIETFKIGVNYAQVLAVAVAVNVQWTRTLLIGFEVLEIAGGVTTDTTNYSSKCLAAADFFLDPSVGSTVIDVMAPVVVLSLFVVGFVAKETARVRSPSVPLKKVALSVVVVLHVSYISLTRTCLSILNCIKVHDPGIDASEPWRRLWAVDTTVRCFEGSHLRLAFGVGLPVLVLIAAGFPVTLAVATWRHADVGGKSGWIYEVAGFTYRAYRQSFVYWDAVIMLRKATLAGVVVFAYPLGPNLQIVLASMVLVMAYALQTSWQPYDEDRFRDLNRVEGLSILVSLITFLSSLVFYDEAVGQTWRVFVTLCVVAINVGFVAYVAQYLIKVWLVYAKALLDSHDIAYDSTRGVCHVLLIFVFVFFPMVIREKAAKLRKSLAESRRTVTAVASTGASS